ncbi:hypothetical protein [Herbiconiux sp. L3-i23]|uniref:hypothetical protein n=1 Tax=Herbiconiux sp. L3-i23 TaxID=2905871 RepID=UPI0020648216|nr:hypothetical protein [Herbiconiux sp. L3-i23]BDI22100.1 hypothetical protein L3i23_08760 [Herbiconiux sp. L3-i23]
MSAKTGLDTLLDSGVGERGLAALLRFAALAYWRELPRALVAGAVLLLAAAPPLIAAVTAAPGWLVALAALPIALAATGAARFAATLARGDRARLRDLLAIDPVLAAVGVAALVLCASALDAPGASPLAGAIGAAILVLVAPMAVGYGAVRGRRGFAAVRGGLILIAFRPSWALTLAAMACLGGFAVVATAGVLAVVVPTLLLVIVAGAVSSLLLTIERIQAGP